MLRLHLLGHVHVSLNGQPVHLSAKSTALLVYLALERAPQHREHLADLLWERADALGNLRVELARLRAAGLDLFPARQPMLSLTCALDLDDWLQQGEAVTERELTDWLSQARSLPLSGLEDLGSTAFQEWIETQRWAICERLEQVLSRVYTRLLEAGRTQAAELVRARGEVLGVELVRLTPKRELGSPHFDRPVERARLDAALRQARREPQLVLLSGRAGSGKRSFLREALAGSEWLLVQVSAAPQRRLTQAAIAQSLTRVASPEARRVLQDMLLNPGDLDDELVRLGSVLVSLGQPVVLAIHGVEQAAPTLAASLEYALDLPMPLVLVVSAEDAARLTGLARGLERADPTRVQRLDLGPIPISSALRVLRAHAQDGAGDEQALYARAARLVQQTDGWPLHMRALMDRPINLGLGRAPLPESVREDLRHEIAGWPDALARDLAQLSLVYDAIDAPLASMLLDRDAAPTLHEAAQRGVLGLASPEELVRVPELTHLPSDLETRLGFNSEPLRTVLAGTLSGAQRGALRVKLADWYFESQPGLSALYAERAGLDDLARLARDADLARLDPTHPRLQAVGGPAAAVHGVPAPAQTTALRVETRTPGGYRVGLEGGWLDVTRFGRFAPPPLLRLQLPPTVRGAWRLVLRLDVFRTGAEMGAREVPYALGLRFGAGDRLVLSSEPLADFTQDGVRHLALGGLPQGRWFEVSGQGGGGALELSTRALDLSVTVGLLEVGGHALLLSEL